MKTIYLVLVCAIIFGALGYIFFLNHATLFPLNCPLDGEGYPTECMGPLPKWYGFTFFGGIIGIIVGLIIGFIVNRKKK